MCHNLNTELDLEFLEKDKIVPQRRKESEGEVYIVKWMKVNYHRFFNKTCKSTIINE